jgi:hypothetical protein
MSITQKGRRSQTDGPALPQNVLWLARRILRQEVEGVPARIKQMILFTFPCHCEERSDEAISAG